MSSRYSNKFIPHYYFYNPKHPDRPVPCKCTPGTLVRLARQAITEICQEYGITRKKYRKLQKANRLN